MTGAKRERESLAPYARGTWESWCQHLTLLDQRRGFDAFQLGGSLGERLIDGENVINRKPHNVDAVESRRQVNV